MTTPPSAVKAPRANTYIATLFPWNRPSRKVRLVNALLARLGIAARLVSPHDAWTDMTSQDQRLNLYHLLSQVLRAGVPGALAELGCFAGQTAALLQRINLDLADELAQAPRPLHLYDSFEVAFGLQRSPRDELTENFASRALPPPVVHAGRFEATLPDALPDHLAFVHIDCGFGGDAAEHATVMTFCLEQVYPRLSPGGVLVLMDYCAPEAWPAWNGNPGVRVAVDAFLADKPETPRILYAGEAAQAVIHKL